ncbi:histidinol-phosphate transaminase [Idiomarina loihiensis]|jgi:histidinol-phosphate aminotransferase|uniref:Histidinol-phosphate aminotransferase 2 n=1 Tax=Idiomarina loihiensis (strain ATCC BAA-735 / DSM 15497 / L2-TR) TaxID=283942 RepID=HIS82_IDILO|nr:MULTISPECIES: histidinol-phosphate transaminase [Idiomarina]Q5QWQ9.1 RecName: Full=Histidinol-phosphate aminotransferase 2; AltName: Full=Imidazole acetol-phosphate transaminase 2 [Idiomarina loihiensis L2TR]AAV82668.1 Histidinol-phosphate/aromatic aminotransferase and cobyric acid decarboxylase [Idiomarina loihiensis L2TR]AGM36710.1 histidinol-phosphate/aromatic aminotransferase and cobyric acid decarboxylase [Idiomarina loihiensis GSL 199]HAS21952.1 histidinol-phosphate aminotransferase [I|tara:strand:+ start:16937 stop:18010 length:1074 start_codon:yes stop_codon:yes gene_type:complete
MSIVEQLQRQHLKQLTPYASARRSMSGGNIWLNANESPYSNSYTVDDSKLNRYPEFQSKPLNQAYAEYAGINASKVLSSRGSDEGIELLIRAFCEPGQDKVLICPPTYGMYAISAKTFAVGVTEVPLLNSGEVNNWQLDTESIIEAAAECKVIFLCSPSNPLGNALNTDDIEQVLQHSPRSIVVVDEAYIEFSSGDSVVSWLERYPNLVVLRTLSKAFALAGIRCGFLLANDDIIELLQKVLAPYPLPDPTVQIAVQALQTSSLERLQQQVATLLAERDRVQTALEQTPLTLVSESDTNFLLYQCEDAAGLVKSLTDNDLLIRNQSAQRGLENVVRITIGSAAENDELIQQLKDYFS